jgi:hypothetical protein
MSDILISSPVVWLYVLYVGALLVAFLVDCARSCGTQVDRRESRSDEGLDTACASRDCDPPAGRPR